MKAYRTINEITSELKMEYTKLTTFELLSVAVQIQRNEILKSGLTVHSEDEHPPALEAIAIQIGYQQHGSFL